MTRTIFVSAAALLAATTLFPPAAESCISCAYVPSVVNSPVESYKAKPNRSYEAKPSRRERSRTVTEERKSRPAKKRTVESETVDKVETGKAAPSETKAEAQMENEHSTISTANLAKAEERQIEAAKADPNVGCKKFFPTVGMTLSVPCE